MLRPHSLFTLVAGTTAAGGEGFGAKSAGGSNDHDSVQVSSLVLKTNSPAAAVAVSGESRD